jgi:hypothetical protein
MGKDSKIAWTDHTLVNKLQMSRRKVTMCKCNCKDELPGFQTVDDGLQCQRCWTIYTCDPEDVHPIRYAIFNDINGDEIGACPEGVKCDCASIKEDIQMVEGGRCLSNGCLYCGDNAVGRYFVKRDKPANTRYIGTGDVDPTAHVVQSADAVCVDNKSPAYLCENGETVSQGWFHCNYRPATHEESPGDSFTLGALEPASSTTVTMTIKGCSTKASPILVFRNNDSHEVPQQAFVVDGQEMTRAQYISHMLDARGPQVRMEADYPEDWWPDAKCSELDNG